jgi:hypothetical protein
MEKMQKDLKHEGEICLEVCILLVRERLVLSCLFSHSLAKFKLVH